MSTPTVYIPTLLMSSARICTICEGGVGVLTDALNALLPMLHAERSTWLEMVSEQPTEQPTEQTTDNVNIPSFAQNCRKGKTD